jgi:hypothetical protein
VERGVCTLVLCSLATVTSFIDASVRIVTQSPKVGPLLIFSISLISLNELATQYLIGLRAGEGDSLEVGGRGSRGLFREPLGERFGHGVGLNQGVASHRRLWETEDLKDPTTFDDGGLR